ncbi:AsmA family protein [Beijerinckia indica]|uniref:AsmA family protein n=1 Tax=Beijerinckia indica subsp. indica (strain ATCC 9039 / DSM 1715 / NCIMB 8712) TaxID=395963 RepID=B2IDZ0_BEII9|nr:AsmA family protein [Beijerinckia indica]ACB96922.1 AsmA family protein [Beijerinckia indica subsp. indica ATCC 9039]
MSMGRSAMQSLASLTRLEWRHHKWASRSAIGLGILMALGIIVSLVAPWLFSASALRGEIEAQIRATTGLAVQSHGRAVLVVLPEPHVNIEAVSFADPSGALRIETPMLKGYFQVLPLLLGRLEIASASLFDAHMVIDLDGRPMPSDSAIGRAADARPATAQAARTDAINLGVLNLINGQALLKSRTSPEEHLIKAINVTLDWRQLGAAAQLIGSVEYHDQSIDLSAWIAKPVELLRGGPSDITLRLEAPSLSLSTRGRLGSEPQFHFNGQMEATTPALRDLLALGDRSLPLPGPFNDIVVSANTVIENDNAAFSNLHLEIDGNRFEGALAMQGLSGKPILSGTLATNLLSLTPWLERLPGIRGSDGQWSSDPFNFTPEDWSDLDLRISASRLRFAPFELQDAAVSIMTRDGRLELAVPAAKAYQGAFKGRASLKLDPDRLDFRANATLSGLDLAAFSLDAYGQRRLGGLVTGTANLEGGGTDMAALMRTIEGHVQVNILQGEIEGLALDQALKNLENRPLALVAAIRGGRTLYDEGTLGLNITKGVAVIEDGLLQSPSLRLGFGGETDIGERSINLHAVATPVMGLSTAPLPANAAKSGGDRPQFRFDLVGSWDDPSLVPDVRSLIRHSNAAAPLFDEKSKATPHGPSSQAETQP